MSSRISSAPRSGPAFSKSKGGKGAAFRGKQAPPKSFKMVQMKRRAPIVDVLDKPFNRPETMSAAQRAGVQRLSGDVYQLFGQISAKLAKKLARAALCRVKNQDRATMLPSDIEFAYQFLFGQKLVGTVEPRGRKTTHAPVTETQAEDAA